MVMRQYVMNVEPALIKRVDRIVRQEKTYSSRNEFIRDAIRSKVMECRKIKIHELREKMRRTALARGWNGEMPTKEERDKIAEEFLKKHGHSFD